MSGSSCEEGSTGPASQRAARRRGGFRSSPTPFVAVTCGPDGGWSDPCLGRPVPGDLAGLLVLGQHGDAPLVAVVVGEGRREEQVDEADRLVLGVVAGTDADDVGVV